MSPWRCSKAYGVWAKKSLYGPELTCGHPAKHLLLIGPDGKMVRAIWEKVTRQAGYCRGGPGGSRGTLIRSVGAAAGPCTLDSPTVGFSENQAGNIREKLTMSPIEIAPQNCAGPGQRGVGRSGERRCRNGQAMFTAIAPIPGRVAVSPMGWGREGGCAEEKNKRR